MPAEGMRGRVTFTVPLPGQDEEINEGWFVLRRRTGLPTLPVLAHAEGGTVVVTVHPPLPDPPPTARWTWPPVATLWLRSYGSTSDASPTNASSWPSAFAQSTRRRDHSRRRRSAWPWVGSVISRS